MFKNTLIFEPYPDKLKMSDEDRAWLLQKGVSITTIYDDALSKLSTGQFIVTAIVGESLEPLTNKFLRTCQKHLGALPQWQIVIGDNPNMDLQLACQELSIRTFWNTAEIRRTFGPWALEQNKLLNDKTEEADRALRIGVALAQEKYEILEKSMTALKEEAQFNFRIAFSIGVYYDRKDRPELALQYYTKATEINKKFIPALYMQAQKLLESGKPGDSLSTFERLENLNPNNPDRKALMAQAYADSGNWDKAKEFRDLAVKLEPDNPKAKELDVRIAFESGNVGDALKALDQCETTNDYFIKKLNAEAVKLSQNDQADEAIKLYSKAHNIAPPTVKFRISYNIALAYYRHEQFAKAQEYCDKAHAECTDPSFDKIEKLRKVLNEKVA